MPDSPIGEPANAIPCLSCGAAVIPGAKYCSQCGTPLDPATPPEPRHPKWYYNVWFVLLMLFFVLGPFGLPLVWKNPRFSRRVKLVLSLVMLAYTLLLIDTTIRAARAVMHEFNQLHAIF